MNSAVPLLGIVHITVVTFSTPPGGATEICTIYIGMTSRDDLRDSQQGSSYIFFTCTTSPGGPCTNALTPPALSSVTP